MGNESSMLAEEEYLHHDRKSESSVEGGECYGFRVLGIQEQSPASTVGFVSFFDFILEANGIRLDTRDATLMELIAQSEDRPMQLRVFNVKAQTSRELQLTPSRKWPGKGLLGVTIRFDSYEGAEDQLLHVLDVAESSPAERAGLRANSDYLLGTPERVFTSAEDLHDEILDALDGSFQCYVYNSLDDQVRVVSIVPTERWGGDGVLGAEVGHGYLHRLPSVYRGTVGSSVGFVNLPKDAKAATDAFLKPQRRDEDSQATSEGHKEGNEVVKSDTMLADLSAHSPQCDANQQPIDTESSNPENDDTASGTTSEMKAAPLAKPRYVAHMDFQLPISTIAVVADP
ncbi:unnamed protein product [Peronospora farinosa]|uniref:PDZ GRASP-type domain-containing protein n=1 Tax=Peronospora farinosa TaxID=134698 RepID=A0AAV0U5N6_9STRA|nr:unnamed protein product [Peronospora farinosa]CAI5730983.1 unnamed protein product [Peronospora farinosa]